MFGQFTFVSMDTHGPETVPSKKKMEDPGSWKKWRIQRNWIVAGFTDEATFLHATSGAESLLPVNS